MKRYIALLRGINISGKNKIVMAELKTAFEKLGFTDVKTHFNSGNVIFSAEKSFTSDDIKEIISESFGILTEVYVTDSEKIADILQNAPEWWGTADKDIYDNLIFVMPTATAEEISKKIGEPSEKLEKIFIYKNVIFWSFDRKKLRKGKLVEKDRKRRHRRISHYTNR